jgi:RNA polymerase sigma-70 factor (ECF subfamily)
MPLLDAFLAALPASARAGFEDTTAIAEVLAGHVRGSRAAYPEVAVTDETFGAELARRLGDDATVERVAKTRADHVFLAIACAAGDAAAIRRFEAEVFEEIDACAARVRATPAQAAEVRGHLQRILFVSEPGRPAALHAYAGRGDLRGYVKVMATRELIRLVDKGKRELGVDDEVLEKLSPADDPALAYLKDRYRADVDAAMRAALVALADQPRALLRYSLIDGWSIDKIGALYGVHRATAARWLTAARDELGAGIRAELARRLTVPVDEVDSIVRLVQSKLDVSLERLL